MNKNDIPSLLRGMGERFNKLLVLVIITVISVVSVGIYTMKDLTIGYKYFDLKSYNTLAVTQEKNFVDKTIEEFLNELETKGYIIASYKLDIDFLSKRTFIRKSNIKDEEFKKDILNNLSIDIFITKLELDNQEIYYFSKEHDCDLFINKINSIIEQEYKKENIIDSYKLISSNEVLDSKINQLTEEKTKKDAEELAKKQAEEKRRKEEEAAVIRQQKKTTSRGSSSINRQGNSRVVNYTYISSPFGMRNGSMHTGIDLAAPAGTSIYAWKSGKIIQASWNGSYGNFISIQHEDGTVSRYAHLSGYNCSVGQYVTKGQVIGFVGSTGNSTRSPPPLGGSN